MRVLCACTRATKYQAARMKQPACWRTSRHTLPPLPRWQDSKTEPSLIFRPLHSACERPTQESREALWWFRWAIRLARTGRPLAMSASLLDLSSGNIVS
jgi:hypothetical protein